jgi:hypothetical protein
MGYIALIVYFMSTTVMPHLKIVNYDLPVSGHPDTALSPEMQHCADAIVCEEQCVTA